MFILLNDDDGGVIVNTNLISHIQPEYDNQGKNMGSTIHFVEKQIFVDNLFGEIVELLVKTKKENLKCL